MRPLASRNPLLGTLQTMPVLAQWTLSLAVQLIAWDHRRRSRKVLGQLGSHLLRDVGLTASEAFHESEKPFWKG